MKKLANAKASGNKKAIKKAQKKVKALKKKVRLRGTSGSSLAAGLGFVHGARRTSLVVQRALGAGLSGATVVLPALVRTLHGCHVSRRYQQCT